MEYKQLSKKHITVNLLIYGITHAVVDGICVAVVLSIFRNQLVSPTEFVGLVILYNTLAFALQSIFGFITDYYKSPRTIAILGCILTGLSAITYIYHPSVTVILAGIGNALFHVGGGSISLNLTPKKATAPGIYVSLGALGLFVGTMLGTNGNFIIWPAILILTISSFLILVIKKPEMNYEKKEIQSHKLNYFNLILLSILLSIAIRSLVGSVLVFPWKTNIDLSAVLIGAIVLGKGFGGILADKFGWIKVSVGALVLSIPLLIFGAGTPILAIFGMFLFNITMPITLVAISNILPGRPGFAFGLTTLVLIIGTFPTYFPIMHILSNNWFIFNIIVISALVLYFGLHKYMAIYEEKNMVK